MWACSEWNWAICPSSSVMESQTPSLPSPPKFSPNLSTCTCAGKMKGKLQTSKVSIRSSWTKSRSSSRLRYLKLDSSGTERRSGGIVSLDDCHYPWPSKVILEHKSEYSGSTRWPVSPLCSSLSLVESHKSSCPALFLQGGNGRRPCLPGAWWPDKRYDIDRPVIEGDSTSPGVISTNVSTNWRSNRQQVRTHWVRERLQDRRLSLSCKLIF